MPDIKKGGPENRVSRRQGWCSGATRWTRTNSSLPKTSSLFPAMEDFRLARLARPFARAAGVKPSELQRFVTTSSGAPPPRSQGRSPPRNNQSPNHCESANIHRPLSNAPSG
ncbi:no significant blast hit [Histoplasma capsulatum G186AR]|uniref:Uncharacterized protein n=1 Tax=Ajellomyces capsulatus TaxID=5037 RepID=A0A8H8D6V6_AJECA|nr:hypothetical protein I7I52_01948 [Histoplasma capsulatum]QSS69424.1 no significant blast hit [Histoplasma capsulatum G186AR]